MTNIFYALSVAPNVRQTKDFENPGDSVKHTHPVHLSATLRG